MYLWSTAMTSGISFVLLCVYVCLVRPMRRERRSIFQAYTASSAALLGNEFFSIKKLVKLNLLFLATSYMHTMQKIETVEPIRNCQKAIKEEPEEENVFQF